MDVVISILVAAGALIIITSPIWLSHPIVDWEESPSLDSLSKWNAFNLVYIPYKKIKSYNLKPKTPLDKEIADEEKEIKFLTEQKAKLDRLDKLKRKKDRLYQEVNVDAQNEDMDVYRCKQCGGTKVTGYRRDYGDGGGTFKYFEHCSDCGIH